MNATTERPASFVPATTAAYRLGISAAWIRTEALAGRLPHIRVGRRLMFNIPVVEAALIEQAQANATSRECHASTA